LASTNPMPVSSSHAGTPVPALHVEPPLADRRTVPSSPTAATAWVPNAATDSSGSVVPLACVTHTSPRLALLRTVPAVPTAHSVRFRSVGGVGRDGAERAVAGVGHQEAEVRAIGGADQLLRTAHRHDVGRRDGFDAEQRATRRRVQARPRTPGIR